MLKFEKKVVIERVTSKEEILKDSIEVCVCTFRDGFSHIIVDDGCYQVVNGNRISSHIDPEALAVINELPKNPKDCYGDIPKESKAIPEIVTQQSVGLLGTMQ